MKRVSSTCSRLHGARVERNYRYRTHGIIIANYITYRVHTEYIEVKLLHYKYITLSMESTKTKKTTKGSL